MRNWRKPMAALLLVMGAATIPFAAPDVSAQAPDAQGWWWQYRQPELPVDPKGVVPQFPETPQLPPPASVPEDGLYVASNPSSPEAISALTWVLPEGAVATKLTLVAAAPLTPTTSIRVCTVNTVWQPVQAGRWSSRPLFQCDADAPVGVVPTDGSTITFELGKIGQSRAIDIALVPTEQSAFQASFNKPDDKALTVVPGATNAGDNGVGGAVLGGGSAPNSLNQAISDPSYMPALSDSLQVGPDTNVGSAPVVDFPQANGSGGTATPVATNTPVKDQLQNFGMFGLLALAALFTRFRNQPSREPKSLVNFGKHRVDEEVS